MACADISTANPVEVAEKTAPSAHSEASNSPRMLLYAIPLSAALWAGIILLALRLRGGL